MKRLFLLLLCVCLLLTGCGGVSVSPTVPSTEATAPVLETVNVITPLLEQGQRVDRSDNLLYIPNSAVETMVCPEVRLFEKGLLLSEYAIDGTQNTLTLKHISLEDGALLAEASIPASGAVTVQVGSNGIGLSDFATGQVLILDDKLHIQQTFSFPKEGDIWYLSPNLDKLYALRYDRGVLERNLETGEEVWIVDSSTLVETNGSTADYVIFTHTDRSNQMTHTRCLNLRTGTLEALPVSGGVNSGTRSGNLWLLNSIESESTYTLVREDTAGRLPTTDCAVSLTTGNHLLLTDYSEYSLYLYDTGGRFLSRCVLPGDGNTPSVPVWSEYWNGYFFTQTVGNTARLLFWDIGADTDGADLEIILPDSTPPEPLMPQELYDRAQALYQRFGVEIRIGEQCRLEFSHHTSYALTDPALVGEALDVLEESLGEYPEGFFRQLPFSFLERICIELVGSLTARENSGYFDAAAFAQPEGNCYYIVMDASFLLKDSVYHEFSHIVDNRLAWDAMLREDALFSEEVWMTLQPEGFQYAMSYSETPEEVRSFADSGYFLSDYALTFPTEDRATLMSAAMENAVYEFDIRPGVRPKMRYYADCIRDCFDTAGWPEVTAWERILT